jgi:hypothetical protein
VKLNISYPTDGDLYVVLVSPRGVGTVLSYFEGGAGANFQGTVFDSTAATPISSGSAPFAGTYSPDGNLGVYNARNALGTWQLWVLDYGFNSGTTNSWSVTITPSTAAPIGRAVTLAGAGTDRAGPVSGVALVPLPGFSGVGPASGASAAALPGASLAALSAAPITLVDALGILSVGQRPSASPLSALTAVLFAAPSPGATPAFLAPLSLGPRMSLASTTGSVVGGAAASSGDRLLPEVGAGATPANPTARPTTSEGGHAPPALDSFEACDACFCAVGAEGAAGKHDQPFQGGDSVLDAPQARVATTLALAVLLGGYCRLDGWQSVLDTGQRLEKRRRCES